MSSTANPTLQVDLTAIDNEQVEKLSTTTSKTRQSTITPTKRQSVISSGTESEQWKNYRNDLDNGNILRKFENLNNNHGGLLSFNNFLSTSTNPKIALMFLPTRSHLQSVLFEIIAEYRQGTKPFCSIKEISNYNEEEEVLFPIGSIFRIESVDNLSNGVTKISLTLTTQEDEQLKQLRQHIRMELGEELDLNVLGILMINMGEYQYAQQYFTTSIQKKKLAHPDISQNHNYIELVHTKNGEYDKALENYERTHQTKSKSLPSNHPSLAATY
ncbi:unnamed protein product, partial [Didymodactylos carnosus]